ncbi:MAG: zf-HC2 domain-containing protein [Lachnospiraceae bacterium]|nr:zf-HC2 domain-containing protein [Lachnospiraceae bacterium]
MNEIKIPSETIKDLLPSYLDGLLSESVKAEVEKYLDLSEECKAYLNELKEKRNAEKDKEESKEESFVNKAKKINYYAIGIIIGASIPVIALAAWIIFINLKY